MYNCLHVFILWGMVVESNDIGRPTLYDESYCQIAIDFLGEGKSITQLARRLGVAKSSVYLWAKLHKEFSDALDLGRELSQAHWEDKLVDMMYSKEVNAPLVKLYFANRFGWHDKAEVDHKSSDGSAGGKEINVTVTRPKPKKD